jgi:hypothetical protein
LAKADEADGKGKKPPKPLRSEKGKSKDRRAIMQKAASLPALEKG